MSRSRAGLISIVSFAILLAASLRAQPAPSIDSFVASPAAITAGQSSTLSWSTSNASSVTLNDGAVTVPVSLTGSVSTTPAATTVYTLTASNTGGASTTKTVTVTVVAPASIDTFAATPAAITAGQSSTLSWSTSGATAVTLNDGSTTVPVAPNGSVSASPAATTTYTLTASNSLGSSTTKSVTVTVVPAPSIPTFTATPPSINAGQAALLTWSTSNAATVTLNDGSATTTVSASGSQSVTPATTTTYTLTAANSLSSSTSKSVTVTVVGAPSISTFSATPSSISAGQSALLTWSTSNAATVTLNDGATTTPVSASGSQSVTPATTTTWTLTATNAVGAAVSKSVTVTVVPLPSITSFTAAPSSIESGQSSTLTWTTANATSVAIDNGVGAQPLNGSFTVSPAAATTYTLTATNATGSTAVRSATVTVTSVARRKLQILLPGESAAPGTTEGKTGLPKAQVAGMAFDVVVNAVDATWNVLTNVNDKVAITSSDAAVALAASGSLSSGSRTFSVTLKTAGSQTLQASNLSDATMLPGASAAFTVTAASSSSIAVARYPAGMLALPDSGGATDSYTLVNTGGGAASITITQSGNFFTQTPTSFSLAAGQSREIFITAAAQPAGSYSGSSIPSGDGVATGLTVPIRLLVSAPPPGKPDVRPLSYRIDTNELLTTGSAAFQNVGDAAATGTFTADVPWLIPQSTPMTIAAGATAAGMFTIDRSLRPDSAAPLGEQTARFRFIYFNGSSSQPATVLGTPPVGTAIVTLVDTVGLKKDAATGIPPLLSGQVARYIMGIAHKSGRVTDLALLNSSSASLSDFRFYFVPTGYTSIAAQAATVSQFSSNAAVGMGDVVSTVFRNDGVTGSMQLRSGVSDLLSTHALLLDQSSASRSVGTALAVLRSDSSAPTGESIFLTGLRKDAQARTDLYIHESAGFAASAQLDFFDTNGTAVGSGRTIDSIAAFSQVELPDAVPSGAILVRITNRTGSQGRLVAEAHVLESGGDVWNVVDAKQTGASRSERVIIPLAASSGSAASSNTVTDLWITNTSGANASGTLTLPANSAGRRRAVRAGTSSAHDATVQAISLAPLQTRVVTDVLHGSTGLTRNGSWYVGFTPSSGEFVLTSRTYVTTPGKGGTIGSSVPAIGVSTAMQPGETRSIAGLEDSSAQTIASAVPGTYRSSVGLVEVGGASATVRLTIRYIYSFASTTQRPPAVSADFTVAAGKFLLVDDLVRSIIGSQRDSYGDLHNIQLDVNVVSGSGAVVAFVLSTDNGSGDFSFVPLLR